MPHTHPSLLVIDDECGLTDLLRESAALRGCRLACAGTLAEALAAVRAEPFHAALVRFGGLESGLDAVHQIKEQSPDTEIIVASSTASLPSAIKSYELAAFAFVQTPIDAEQLFVTIDRALERRRISVHNRRLLWELQTINEIAEGISCSLELDTVLAGALQRIVRAFDAVGGSIRLRDDLTGRFETKAFIGPSRMLHLWEGAQAEAGRPSDQVIATRVGVIIGDLEEVVSAERLAELPVRSAISVPMFAASELVGTLSVGASRPFRFHFSDEQLLSIIGGQIVVAVQNARLHDSVSRGKREWERTFDAIGEPIAVFDGRGHLLRGNTALAALLGLSITDIRNVTCSEVGFCGGGCPFCSVGRALAHDAVSRAEITLADDQIFSVTTFPVGGRREDASVVQVAKNVTEEIRSARRLQQMSDELAMTNAQLVAALDQLKSTQAQLLQAEKLSAIGQLVAGVAHELNNPLTSVIGYAQLLEEELLHAGRSDEARPPAELAQDLRRIAEESERAARIVRNLLAFARRQTAARVSQDINELVTRVLSLRTYDLRLNNIELRTEFPPDLPPVVADGGQLQQALLNLILNAEQAMRGRTTRRLIVGARFDPASAAVEVYVSDTGHGIDPANRSRIFDPFFTTREVGEGTGLGLSICYGIVRTHGGQIAVDSKIQVGTTFSMLLPAQVEVLPEEEILIAQADQGDREFITAALGAWGYSVVATGRADEALERYLQGGLQMVLIDGAVLGADLPGWRAARADAGRTVPLVLMTMTGDGGDVERFGREQASAVLAPPFQLRTLRSAIRAAAKEKAFV